MWNLQELPIRSNVSGVVEAFHYTEVGAEIPRETSV